MIQGSSTWWWGGPLRRVGTGGIGGHVFGEPANPGSRFEARGNHSAGDGWMVKVREGSDDRPIGVSICDHDTNRVSRACGWKMGNRPKTSKSRFDARMSDRFRHKCQEFVMMNAVSSDCRKASDRLRTRRSTRGGTWYAVRRTWRRPCQVARGGQSLHGPAGRSLTRDVGR